MGAIKQFPWLKIDFIGQAQSEMWLEFFHDVGLANYIRERRNTYLTIYIKPIPIPQDQGRI